MDLKEAISTAKTYAAELYQSEGGTNFGLEEVRKSGDVWEVTIGFSRPWDAVLSGVGIITGTPQYKREYKVLRVRDDTGQVIEMINRDG
jgi:hypothetical protein